jgi:hypothetical protein
MSIHRKVLVILSLMSSLLLALPATAAGPVGCQQIRDWVKSNEDVLPRDYEGISKFPLAYRRVIFGALMPAEKSEMWRTHLETYLATNPDLTTVQRDLIREAVELVSAGLFATSQQDKRWSRDVRPALSDLEKRIHEAFSAAQASEIFEQIGPPELRLFTSKLTSGIACACARASDYCPNGYGCANNVGCDAGGHCGTFWAYTCDGLCKDANANLLLMLQP